MAQLQLACVHPQPERADLQARASLQKMPKAAPPWSGLCSAGTKGAVLKLNCGQREARDFRCILALQL